LSSAPAIASSIETNNASNEEKSTKQISSAIIKDDVDEILDWNFNNEQKSE
jgi:hypothetical protein